MCFLEGFVDSTIVADKLDVWGECRQKKADACTQVEDALNVAFEGPTHVMAGVNMLKEHVDELA